MTISARETSRDDSSRSYDDDDYSSDSGSYSEKSEEVDRPRRRSRGSDQRRAYLDDSTTSDEDSRSRCSDEDSRGEYSDEGSRSRYSDDKESRGRYSDEDSRSSDEGSRSRYIDEGSRSRYSDEDSRSRGSYSDEGSRSRYSDEDSRSRYSDDEYSDEGSRSRTSGGSRCSDDEGSRSRRSGGRYSDEDSQGSGSRYSDEDSRRSGDRFSGEGSQRSGSRYSDEDSQRSGSRYSDEDSRRSGDRYSEKGSQRSGDRFSEEGSQRSGSRYSDDDSRSHGYSSEDRSHSHYSDYGDSRRSESDGSKSGSLGSREDSRSYDRDNRSYGSRSYDANTRSSDDDAGTHDDADTRSYDDDAGTYDDAETRSYDDDAGTYDDAETRSYDDDAGTYEIADTRSYDDDARTYDDAETRSYDDTATRSYDDTATRSYDDTATRSYDDAATRSYGEKDQSYSGSESQGSYRSRESYSVEKATQEEEPYRIGDSQDLEIEVISIDSDDVEYPDEESPGGNEDGDSHARDSGEDRPFCDSAIKPTSCGDNHEETVNVTSSTHASSDIATDEESPEDEEDEHSEHSQTLIPAFRSTLPAGAQHDVESETGRTFASTINPPSSLYHGLDNKSETGQTFASTTNPAVRDGESETGRTFASAINTAIHDGESETGHTFASMSNPVVHDGESETGKTFASTINPISSHGTAESEDGRTFASTIHTLPENEDAKFSDAEGLDKDKRDLSSPRRGVDASNTNESLSLMGAVGKFFWEEKRKKGDNVKSGDSESFANASAVSDLTASQQGDNSSLMKSEASLGEGQDDGDTFADSSAVSGLTAASPTNGNRSVRRDQSMLPPRDTDTVNSEDNQTFANSSSDMPNAKFHAQGRQDSSSDDDGENDSAIGEFSSNQSDHTNRSSQTDEGHSQMNTEKPGNNDAGDPSVNEPTFSSIHTSRTDNRTAMKLAAVFSKGVSEGTGDTYDDLIESPAKKGSVLAVEHDSEVVVLGVDLETPVTSNVAHQPKATALPMVDILDADEKVKSTNTVRSEEDSPPQIEEESLRFHGSEAELSRSVANEQDANSGVSSMGDLESAFDDEGGSKVSMGQACALDGLESRSHLVFHDASDSQLGSVVKGDFFDDLSGSGHHEKSSSHSKDDEATGSRHSDLSSSMSDSPQHEHENLEDDYLRNRSIELDSSDPSEEEKYFDSPPPLDQIDSQDDLDYRDDSYSEDATGSEGETGTFGEMDKVRSQDDLDYRDGSYSEDATGSEGETGTLGEMDKVGPQDDLDYHDGSYLEDATGSKGETGACDGVDQVRSQDDLDYHDGSYLKDGAGSEGETGTLDDIDQVEPQDYCEDSYSEGATETEGETGAEGMQFDAGAHDAPEPSLAEINADDDYLHNDPEDDDYGSVFFEGPEQTVSIDPDDSQGELDLDGSYVARDIVAQGNDGSKVKFYASMVDVEGLEYSDDDDSEESEGYQRELDQSAAVLTRDIDNSSSSESDDVATPIEEDTVDAYDEVLYDADGKPYSGVLAENSSPIFLEEHSSVASLEKSVGKSASQANHTYRDLEHPKTAFQRQLSPAIAVSREPTRGTEPTKSFSSSQFEDCVLLSPQKQLIELDEESSEEGDHVYDEEYSGEYEDSQLCSNGDSQHYSSGGDSQPYSNGDSQQYSSEEYDEQYDDEDYYDGDYGEQEYEGGDYQGEDYDDGGFGTEEYDQGYNNGYVVQGYDQGYDDQGYSVEDYDQEYSEEESTDSKESDSSDDSTPKPAGEVTTAIAGVVTEQFNGEDDEPLFKDDDFGDVEYGFKPESADESPKTKERELSQLDIARRWIWFLACTVIGMLAAIIALSVSMKTRREETSVGPTELFPKDGVSSTPVAPGSTTLVPTLLATAESPSSSPSLRGATSAPVSQRTQSPIMSPTMVPTDLGDIPGVFQEGERAVRVTREPIEGSNELSDKKCIEYLRGATDYTTACFSTTYNRNGLALSCAVEFDSVTCSSCSICVGGMDTPDLPYVGFELDCTNVQADETTESCTEFSHMNIQEVLVDDQFPGQRLWPENAAPSPAEPSNESPTKIPVAVGNQCLTSREELVEVVDWYLANDRGDYITSTYGGTIGDWCFNGVSDFSFLFAASRNRAVSSFNGDISNWDMSSATNTESMFEGASRFNGDLSAWNVGSVENMANMFSAAASFKSDLSGWQVSEVTNMQGMFARASSFNSDISGWDVSQVKDMSKMFYIAFSFNQDISGWKLDSVETLQDTFYGARFFAQDLCRWGSYLSGRNIVTTNMFSRTSCPATTTVDLALSLPSPLCFDCAASGDEEDPALAGLDSTALALYNTLCPLLIETECSALLDEMSAQGKAFTWLTGNPNIALMTTTKKVQRFVLAVVYYSMGGESWTNQAFWRTNLDECLWYSSFSSGPCDSLNTLVTLALDDNNLQGAIPPEVGMLTGLTTLSLRTTTDSDGPFLTGGLPSAVGLLSSLTSLRITGHSLTSIPSNLGNLGQLDTLDLSSNGLSGPIPSEFGNLGNLERLFLNDNNLAGQIPESLSGLAKLATVRVDDNDLTGAIPDSVCQLWGDGVKSYADCTELEDEASPCVNFCCYDDKGCACRYEQTNPELCLF